MERLNQNSNTIIIKIIIMIIIIVIIILTIIMIIITLAWQVFLTGEQWSPSCKSFH